MIGTPSKLLGYGLSLALSASSIHTAGACTRVLYAGDAGLVIAGRSMDWSYDTRTNLWVFPRGMQRDGAAGANSAKWTCHDKRASLRSAARAQRLLAGVGGATFLPGTIHPADRFVRAYYLVTSIPESAVPDIIAAVPDGSYRNQAVASVASVLRAVSVPFGMSSPGEPNVASTLWRTWADQTNLVYFFDSATSPNMFWVSLADLDFGEGAEVKKLTLTGGKIYSGNAADKFEPAKPFAFLPYAS